MRDITAAQLDTTEKGKRRLAALLKHKQILETTQEHTQNYGRWKKVEGQDIIQILENKTLETLAKHTK